MQSYPLNIDAGMYWAWKIGYVFFKIEGTAMVGDSLRGFFYHVGDDTRFSTLTFPTAITVTRSAQPPVTVGVDVNRLFVTPMGDIGPDFASTNTAERIAHSGTYIDMVLSNMRFSGVFTVQ